MAAAPLSKLAFRRNCFHSPMIYWNCPLSFVNSTTRHIAEEKEKKGLHNFTLSLSRLYELFLADASLRLRLRLFFLNGALGVVPPVSRHLIVAGILLKHGLCTAIGMVLTRTSCVAECAVETGLCAFD